jgi:hypothetical protein
MSTIKTVLIRQLDAISPVQFSRDNTNWVDITTWPFTIGNILPNNTKLKIKFTTNITLPVGITEYFVLKAHNIIIDGNSKTITAKDCLNFPGLITNGTASENGYNNVTVKNIIVVSTGTTNLSAGNGWICRQYFGKGSTGNSIQNCSSNGIIPADSGGITGRYTANNSTNFTITGCSASGSILSGANGARAGGIVGPLSGTSRYLVVTITSCTYSGDINGNFSGGIIGASSGNVFISYCSTSGIIKGGGIAGDFTGVSGLVTISDCFSKGDIGSIRGGENGGSAGGIIAAYAGDVTITRCYSIGAIGGPEKNDAGGIVGAFGGGAVNVDACFSVGDISKNCGGIVARYFGYNSQNRCNINNCYTLGDIGENAGGIAGPEWAAGVTLATCYISRCYSMGLLKYNSSGGIIAPTTVSYPTDKHTVDISFCFNGFADTLVTNSIVGLGYQGMPGQTFLPGIPKSTFPSKQTVTRPSGAVIEYTTVDGWTYSEAVTHMPTKAQMDASKARDNTYNPPFYKLQSSTNSKTAIRLPSGYYKLHPDIIKKSPFTKINLLGFEVSNFVLDGGFTTKDLLDYNIYLKSTLSEFNKTSIGLSDLFTANYDLPTICNIGYDVGSVLTVRPNTTLKALADAKFNFKTSTKPGSQLKYTVDDLIAPSVTPPLTVLDITNTGFLVIDIRNRTEAMFSLANMRESYVPANYLLGPGGYSANALKVNGFNVEHFRIGGFKPQQVLGLGFKPEEFQCSKFKITDFNFTSLDRYGNTVSLFHPSQLINNGFNRNDVIDLTTIEVSVDTKTEEYIKQNVPINQIIKKITLSDMTTNIRNMRKYELNQTTYPNYSNYTPIEFLKNGWTKYQVGRMRFTARALLDTNIFSLSELKTVGYSDSEILASGHPQATQSNLNQSDIFRRVNPPVIEEVITSDTTVYVYFSSKFPIAVKDYFAIGYSLDINAENMTLEYNINSPLIIKNVDFSKDNYINLTFFNGRYSTINSVSVAKYQKPIGFNINPDNFKLTVDIFKNIGGIIEDISGIVDSVNPNVISGANVKINNRGAESLTNWTDGKWSYFPLIIAKVDKISISDYPGGLTAISNYIKTQASGYKTIVTRPDTYGSDYVIRQNDAFLTSVPTITKIDGLYGTCKVYFTNNIKNNETFDDIYYSLDDSENWQPCGNTPQKTSPLTISGDFIFFNADVSIRIRYYSKKDVQNENSLFNFFAMNYVYSEPTSNNKVTFPVRLGRFSDASNIVEMISKFPPLTPTVHYVRYQPNLSPWIRVYFSQLYNSAGHIKDYEWSKDRGNTWTSAGLNLTVPPIAMNTRALGIEGNRVPIDPIYYIDIKIGNKSPSYKIWIRAVNTNDVRSYTSITSDLLETKILSDINDPNKRETGKTTDSLSIGGFYNKPRVGLFNQYLNGGGLTDIYPVPDPSKPRPELPISNEAPFPTSA